MSRTYLTTPLFYVNAEPHLGHTYTMVVVDTVARYARSRGVETFFLTGTDEHGEKIVEAAHAAGETPKAYADRISTLFRSTWDACGIRYDHFIRTTDAHHVRNSCRRSCRASTRAATSTSGNMRGLYCTGCERFYTEKELVDGKCPDHKIEPRLHRGGELLLPHESLSAAPARPPSRITRTGSAPSATATRSSAMLREPLEDLCISRPKARLTWGIELPFDDRTSSPTCGSTR